MSNEVPNEKTPGGPPPAKFTTDRRAFLGWLATFTGVGAFTGAVLGSTLIRGKIGKEEEAGLPKVPDQPTAEEVHKLSIADLQQSYPGIPVEKIVEDYLTITNTRAEKLFAEYSTALQARNRAHRRNVNTGSIEGAVPGGIGGAALGAAGLVALHLSNKPTKPGDSPTATWRKDEIERRDDLEKNTERQK